LLTDAYDLPPGLHVVEDYLSLLSLYLNKDIEPDPPELSLPNDLSFALATDNYVILNVRSGPPSRFIPVAKAVEIIKAIKSSYPYDIVLTGAAHEKEYIDEIERRVTPEYPIINLAGKTSIPELGYVLQRAKVMITTDSGNAHFANALGTGTVVLFGAGLQSRCHPYKKDLVRALQLLDLDCVPCRSETCKFGDNRCLANIDNASILAAVDELLAVN
jgi:ADP-heptose:LPS heptosyltransferase